jgi:pimeloyl-ACP methyl ester carboxylesterase
MTERLSATTGPLAIQEGMITIRHQRLFYRRMASPRFAPDTKPHLVFLHEGLGCTAMWHDFPAHVAADTGLSAIVYDRSGYGRSPDQGPPRGKRYLHLEAQEVLPRLLEYLQIERAILIGHSDGGSIALLTAAACPDRIAGIVTEAAHVYVEPLTLEGIRKTVATYETRHLEQRLARYHGVKGRKLFFAWADTWQSASFRSWNIEKYLGMIQCPALIIQGQEDPYGSARQVESIVTGIGSQATPMLIPACGHNPHRDTPGSVREAIAAFVAPLR